MFRRILVGYDGSPHARHALEVALDLARRYGSEVEAAAVAQVPDYAGSIDEIDESVRQGEAFYEAAFGPARELARDMGVDLETRVLKGHAAQAAERTRAGLIVVGSRGLATFRRYLVAAAGAAWAVVVFGAVRLFVPDFGEEPRGVLVFTLIWGVLSLAPALWRRTRARRREGAGPPP